MHKIYKEGDTARGPCERCRKLVSTTFRYAPLRINGVSIPDVLQDFCDECGESVSIPHQSTYRIREYREQHNHVVELRVPGHLVDILLAIGMTRHVSQKPNSLCRVVSELYLSKYGLPEGDELARRVVAALDDDLAGGRSSHRLSCLFPDTIYTTLKMISNKEERGTSALVKGIIVAAKHDLLDNGDRKLGKEFDRLAATRM